MGNIHKETFVALKSIGIDDEHAVKLSEALSQHNADIMKEIQALLIKQEEKIHGLNIKFAVLTALQSLGGALIFILFRHLM